MLSSDSGATTPPPSPRHDLKMVRAASGNAVMQARPSGLLHCLVQAEGPRFAPPDLRSYVKDEVDLGGPP